MIKDYYTGKHIFVTGVTGFVGTFAFSLNFSYRQGSLGEDAFQSQGSRKVLHLDKEEGKRLVG
jgi:hypothetical protein